MGSVAYVVFDNWRAGDSGVDTFMRHLEPLFRDGSVEGELVEIPYREDDCRRPDAPATGHPPAACAAGASRPAPGSRLLLSYARRVWHDVRVLWPVRARLRGRVLVTNQFGCETLPIALRILAPLGTVMAVCHTHPPPASHGGDSVRRLVERLCYRSATHLVYNSNSVRAEWRKRLGLKRIKGDVIRYGIAAPDETLPDDYPLKPAEAVDFVCVSRFVRWKGHKELIEAFARAVALLPSDHPAPPPPSLRLILVGDGPTRPPCTRYALDIGLSVFPPVANSRIPEFADSPPSSRGSVYFLGARPDAARYFNGADVGVQLSVEPEAFGIVLVEAMSRGKPVLASRIGGIPEAVEEQQTGTLVHPADTEEVARAMVHLACHSQERIRMGEAGVARWRAHFTVQRMQCEYAAVFRIWSGGSHVRA